MCEAQFRWFSWGQAILALLLFALGLTITFGPPALATMRYGPLQISGNLETQELIRDTSPTKFQFVQNRNTFRLRIDWDTVKKGRLWDKFDVPFVENSKLYILYRGVYDGFYDIAPTDLQHGQSRLDDLVGGPINGNTIGQCVGGPCPVTPTAGTALLPGSYTRLSDRQKSGIKFENTLREAYSDIKLKGMPVSLRLGRQQVIWGESDQFRLMDIWNPLDVTWHFQQEQSWDNIRIPLWLAKGLWDIGQLGPLSNTFLEVVYNPFDFQPGAKVGFLPQPWSVPIPDPLRSGQVNQVPGSVRLSPVFDLQGSSYRHGDFQRNPADASEIGTRFHGVTPQGLEFSLDYLYGRGRGVGAASPFAVKIESLNVNATTIGQAPTIGLYQEDINQPGQTVRVVPIDVNAKIVYPYMHIFGLTGNYFESDYTASVLRFETAYAMGEPFQTVDENNLPCISVGGRQRCDLGRAPIGFTKRDVWAGMLGFDRPTWIRFLNSKATWFLSGQFFWNYTTGGHVDQLRGGTSGVSETPYSGPIGQWISGQFAGQVEREQSPCPPACGNGDQVRRWEHLITVAATSFYRGGTVVPFVANAWDPVNDNNETLWYIDYFYTNDVIITLGQRFFYTYGSKVNSIDPWFAGGAFARRDETSVKLTYQF